MFSKICNFDLIINLVKSMLLEKKIILIKSDISDVAVIIQNLITLIQPFKWNFCLINNLPSDMIEALESP